MSKKICIILLTAVVSIQISGCSSFETKTNTVVANGKIKTTTQPPSGKTFLESAGMFLMFGAMAAAIAKGETKK